MPPLFLAFWGPWGECLDIQAVLPPLGFLGRRGGNPQDRVILGGLEGQDAAWRRWGEQGTPEHLEVTCAPCPRPGDSRVVLASQLLFLAGPWPLCRGPQCRGRQGPAAGSCCPFSFSFPRTRGIDGDGMRNPCPPPGTGGDGEAQDLLGSSPPSSPVFLPFKPGVRLCLVGGCKNSTWFELGGWRGRAGRGPGCGGGGPVSPFPGGIREATCCQECLAGRGKRRLRGGEQASAQMEI